MTSFFSNFSKSALNVASASIIASKDFLTSAGKSSASMFCHFNSSRAIALHRIYLNDQTESFALSAKWPSPFLWERNDFLWCPDLGVCNASVKRAAFDGIVVVARSSLRRLASKNSNVFSVVAVEILNPPCALKFEVGHQGEVARFKWLKLFAHSHIQRLRLGRSSIFEEPFRPGSRHCAALFG
jgi:hypothetical protein